VRFSAIKGRCSEVRRFWPWEAFLHQKRAGALSKIVAA
jgi:hypothetical protein